MGNCTAPFIQISGVPNSIHSFKKSAVLAIRSTCMSVLWESRFREGKSQQHTPEWKRHLVDLIWMVQRHFGFFPTVDRFCHCTLRLVFGGIVLDPMFMLVVRISLCSTDSPQFFQCSLQYLLKRLHRNPPSENLEPWILPIFVPIPEHFILLSFTCRPVATHNLNYLR